MTPSSLVQPISEPENRSSANPSSPGGLEGQNLLAYVKTLKFRSAQISAAHLQTAGIILRGDRENCLKEYSEIIDCESPDLPAAADYLFFLAGKFFGADPLRMCEEVGKAQSAIATALHKNPYVIAEEAGILSHRSGGATSVMHRRIIFLPHTGNRGRPADFYNAYPELQEAMRRLASPVIIAAENSVFTVASINPVTALMAADVLKRVVTASQGYVPFVSSVITGLQRWERLRESHFPQNEL